MSANPFLSHERQNFPAFSPMFAASSSRTTPPSNQAGEFSWSIDHIAMMKPVDIATDPVSLSITNGMTPESKPDSREEKSIEKFFSQKSILPSPWMPARAPVKRVTFSPHPPATTFYETEESCFVNNPKGTVDAVTQTIMSIPTDVNLEQLLGPIFYVGEEANTSLTSLRRKLFGQPQRVSFEDNSDGQSKSSSSDGSCASAEVHHHNSVSPAAMPSSFGLFNSSVSSAFLLTTPNGHNKSWEEFECRDKEESDHPLESSFAINLPTCNLPDISPIAMTTPVKDCGKSAVIKSTSAVQPSHDKAGLLEQLSTVGGGLGKGAHNGGNDPREDDSTSMCSLQNDPLLVACSTPDARSHQLVEWSDVGGYPEKSAGPEKLAGPKKATSTPNQAKPGVLKRQLVVSPFASPVLKQQCVHRADERSLQQLSSDSDTGPLVLSLGDLQTDLNSLTNVTSTACTSCFTHMKIDDGEDGEEGEEVEKEKDGLQEEGHPIHSIITQSQWQPPKHSTMLDQPKEMTTIGDQPQSACTGQLSLPSLSTDSGMASGDALCHSQALVTSIGTIPTKTTMPLSANSGHKDNENGEGVCTACPVSDGRKTVSHPTAFFSTSVPSSGPVDSGLSISAAPHNDSEATSTHEPGKGTKTVSDTWGTNVGHPQLTTWNNTTPSKWLGPGANGGSCNTLQQILSGKRNPAFTISTLLPSRLRVTSHSSNSSSNSSPSTSPCRLGGRESLTPSGRNVGNRSVFATGGHFPQELLRKKCSLKSRLKFSPIEHENTSLSGSLLGNIESLKNGNGTRPPWSGGHYSRDDATTNGHLKTESLKPYMPWGEPAGPVADSSAGQRSSIQGTTLHRHYRSHHLPSWFGSQLKNEGKVSQFDYM